MFPHFHRYLFPYIRQTQRTQPLVLDYAQAQWLQEDTPVVEEFNTTTTGAPPVLVPSALLRCSHIAVAIDVAVTDVTARALRYTP